MPLGYERLNERTQRPNARINFIKPLTTSSPEDQKIAKDFLERIAAQCAPVMKKEYLSVMALEEFPPNSEFLGRNFNAGECIQLVLKDKAGRWLSFKFVQMVMMHELAHCKQMNHSKFFWQVRNKYADHMKELWAKKYEGEGLWGRGQELTTGVFIHDRVPDNADIPEHLCGGTYRRARGKKRKRGQHEATDKPKLSYAERQQKRIAKKFGVHGEGHGLGENELVRGALEQGHRRPGKPKVANSKRGRELRANAALARFEAAKEQQQQAAETTPELEEDDEDDSETESDDEFADGLPTLDTLEKIKDQQGRDLYQVCGDEGEQDEGGLKEMDELRLIGVDNIQPTTGRKTTPAKGKVRGSSAARYEDSETESEPEKVMTRSEPKVNSRIEHEGPGSGKSSLAGLHEHLQTATGPDGIRQTTNGASNTILESVLIACPICSLENEADSPTCMACSNVLKPSLVRNHWHCKSDQCKGTSYINAGDVGRCGLCGASKPVAVDGKAMGVVGADVLRWD